MESNVESSSSNTFQSQDTGSVIAVENRPEIPFLNYEEQQLSKRQRRRLLKKELWKSRLKEKRAKEKMKLKQKRAEARKNNLELGPSRKDLKKNTMALSLCKVKVVLDFSFDEYMDGLSICKVNKQTLRCYSLNRRAENPVQLYLVSMSGKSLEELERHTGYKHWDINISEETYSDLFPKEELVYLTSESENVIQSFDENKCYIIGALVDHNSEKGLCYNIAKKQGIAHGRLPIDEYVNMKSRKVLAINHVFHIIVEVCNGKSWKDAFLTAIPQRKGATGKAEGDDDDDDECELSNNENSETGDDGKSETADVGSESSINIMA